MNEDDTLKIMRRVHYKYKYSFNTDGGLGSLSDTCQQANIHLNVITDNDVKECLSRQKSRQTKSYRGFSSYVAHEPLQAIQIGLAVCTDSAPDNDSFKYVFVAVDLFSIICHAVPTKYRRPEESVRAIE